MSGPSVYLSTVMDLGSWTIFSLLDKEFSAQIRLACVFGKDNICSIRYNSGIVAGNLGNEALIVTRDDEVFALGSNGAGCLGLGDMHSTLAPKQVEPLCYKVVLDNLAMRLNSFSLRKLLGLLMALAPMFLLTQSLVSCTAGDTMAIVSLAMAALIKC